jgi:hypothetical protein
MISEGIDLCVALPQLNGHVSDLVRTSLGTPAFGLPKAAHLELPDSDAVLTATLARFLLGLRRVSSKLVRGIER